MPIQYYNDHLRPGNKPLSPEERKERRKIAPLTGGAMRGKNRAQRQRLTSAFAQMYERRTLPSGW